MENKNKLHSRKAIRIYLSSAYRLTVKFISHCLCSKLRNANNVIYNGCHKC